MLTGFVSHRRSPKPVFCLNRHRRFGMRFFLRATIVAGLNDRRMLARA
jgi:hypothetical protein